MTGLIWFVQIVHYPLFAVVGETQAVPYATAHANLTGYVVGPPMLLELGGTFLILAPSLRPFYIPTPEAWVGAALLALIWASTGLLQVPLHNRLGQHRNPAAILQLVRTNWIRTVAWSLRAILVLLWTYRALNR